MDDLLIIVIILLRLRFYLFLHLVLFLMGLLIVLILVLLLAAAFLRLVWCGVGCYRSLFRVRFLSALFPLYFILLVGILFF